MGGFTRVRCCRNTWGFVRCGSFVHHRGCGWRGGGGGVWRFNEVAQDENVAEPAEGPFLEVPDESEADKPKPEIDGWEKSLNATSLEPSASYWGHGFCRSHRVGYFCQGFTRVRCCKNTWGFVQCGSFVHHRGCGWRGGGGGVWRFNEVAKDENIGKPAEGPFLEVPDESEADKPKPEIDGWEKSLNATSLEPSASYWGNGFC